MILNYEQIKSVTFGAAQVKEIDGKMRFYRFNDEELAYYRGTRFEEKSNASSGISLEFVTDATDIRITAKAHAGSSRTYFAIDVLVNGELVNSIRNFPPEVMTGAYTGKQFEKKECDEVVSLGEGEKKVAVILPWSATPEISLVELVNATFFTPVIKSKKMIVYGDSITQGYDATTPSKSYASQLVRALDADARNKAIGGEVFCPELSKIKNDIEPDYITVAYGTNDWSRIPRAQIKENAKQFYLNLRTNYPNAKIFAITPIWRKDYTREDRYDFMAISEIINNSVKDIPGVVVIEGFDIVPHSEEYFADLRLHPNDAGFAYYAKNLIAEIKKHI